MDADVRRKYALISALATGQELKIRAIELGAVSVIRPLLLPVPPKCPYLGEASEENKASSSTLKGNIEETPCAQGGEAFEKRDCLGFLCETPLQRAGWVYVGGTNAQSPAAALAVGDPSDYAAVQAAVLNLLTSLGRRVSARKEMQGLGVFRDAGDLFISHSNNQIRCGACCSRIVY